ncbi:putative methyltransferase [Ectocarpus siliculosus]|uniref:Methyltransferase n=1 Tax=Ectocarpus siliculosus TaxID=2880 RepID=D7FK50_ECTSI|nr:putative methyltransferase [Ectocarpus siliculosus]|eukprot:CBJ29260.1 putative methyltransferase [Ectocarpus siliculosus]
MYRLGRLDIQGIDCSQPSQLYSPGTILCNPSAPAAAASRAELKETWLADSTSSLMACRAFFDVSEMEYAKAACLRAVRLGGTSADEAAEVDMRLAAIAERYGHPSAAVHMYFHMMANPATNDHGRLVMSILGLTMVPPTLIGSRRTIAEFRSGWVRDLQTLRRNLATGATPGELWDPAGEVGRTPFNLAHQGGPDLDMMTSLAGVYDAAAPSLRYVAPHCRRDMGDDKAATTNQGHSERPVRIGGGGDGDGGDSQAGDKEGGRGGDDPVVNGLRSAVHHWHQAPRDLHSARRAVSQEKLDVLVYPDLGMEPLTYFLAFARLAPVQCVWWGHPVTPSTGSVDYFLSLDVELEGGQDDYLEQMVRMDVVNTAHFKQMAAWVSDLGLPSEPPGRRDNNRDKGPQSPLSFTNGGVESLSTSLPSTIKSSSNADMADVLQISVPYADLAAAEAGPTTPATAATTGVAARTHNEHDVTIGEQDAGPSCRHKYLVMGRLFKLHPDFDAAIEGILEGDKDGCVILIHETKDEEWTRVVWSRLRDVLAPRGRTPSTCMCDGLFGRLRIMHHWLYPQALRRATAVLDTFPYGGCLTVLEGLSNGVPVVTLPAKYVRGRFALAMYQQMGYTELVADDVQEYVSLAVQLGKDRDFRQKVVTKVEGAYRESLHQHHQSAQEWAAFIVRAHRGAESNR